jgi:PAS domain S-box-containing protein
MSVAQSGACNTPSADIQPVCVIPAADIAPDALILVRPGCTIRIANEQAERLFGYARSELVGKPVEVLMPQRYRERHESHQKSYFADPSRPADGKRLRHPGADQKRP